MVIKYLGSIVHVIYFKVSVSLHLYYLNLIILYYILIHFLYLLLNFLSAEPYRLWIMRVLFLCFKGLYIPLLVCALLDGLTVQ